jgi:putative ABC transport system substrate-binding protein
MTKQIIALALCAMLFAPCYPVEAQQPKKVPRIGYLSNSNPATESTRTEAIRRALRELGYIEGQNVATEYRYAEGKRDRLPELAAELVRLKVDIIVVGGSPGIQSAKNATKTIPIIMVGFPADPVEAGLVESLARPGGNVNRLSSLSRELAGKRLELLKEVVPKVARVAVLYEPAIPGAVLELKDVLPVTARALRLTLQPWEVRAADDFDSIFAAMGKQRADGLYVTGAGSVMGANEKRIADFAVKSRLPAIYYIPQFVEAGGLMTYGVSLNDLDRRAATYVDKSLKGTKPADLPVEQPKKFELVINLKTAKQIGLTIPPNVLARADRVIK